MQPSSLRAIEALLPIERIADLPILSKSAGYFPDAFAHFSTLEDLTLVLLNPKDVSRTPAVEDIAHARDTRTTHSCFRTAGRSQPRPPFRAIGIVEASRCCFDVRTGIVFQAHLIMQSMSKLSASKLAVVEMSAAGGGPPRMEVRSTQHSLSSASDAQHFT